MEELLPRINEFLELTTVTPENDFSKLLDSLPSIPITNQPYEDEDDDSFNIEFALQEAYRLDSTAQ